MSDSFNAADHKQVTERDKKRKRDRKQELADLRAVLELSEGRRVLWGMLEHCGLYRTPFHPNNNEMSKNCGLQSVALHLLAQINEADEKMWLLMQQENL